MWEVKQECNKKIKELEEENKKLNEKIKHLKEGNTQLKKGVILKSPI